MNKQLTLDKFLEELGKIGAKNKTFLHFELHPGKWGYVKDRSSDLAIFLNDFSEFDGALEDIKRYYERV
jgi:hypothetical protein